MLLHLSPEGGKVVSALFLGFVLMLTSLDPPPILPPFSRSHSLKKTKTN